MDVMKYITNSILENRNILKWDFKDESTLSKLGNDLLGKKADFDNIKRLRPGCTGLCW